MLQTTAYYEEFIRYYKLAEKQQALCNLGSVPYLNCGIYDDLMRHVELYDVVERKFAGFSQIINDAFYGWTTDHPYWSKMKDGIATAERTAVAQNWTGKRSKFGLAEWLYLFILHRVCGSAINYSVKPSGYHNTLLFNLHVADTIEGMTEIVNLHPKPFYTSVGYQFPAFPKPPAGTSYKRGGDYYLTEFAPKLARELAAFLFSGDKKKSLRTIGDWMLAWNVNHKLRQYHFQYAAVVADIADWFPEFVDRESMFYYGSNAIECISYLAEPIRGMKKPEWLDLIMRKIYEDTGAFPYNSEDVACDMIRYLTNYFKTGDAYNHLDADTLWNSSTLIHPYGRQKAMLDLGLVKSFNDFKGVYTGDQVLKASGLSEKEYIDKVKSHPKYSNWIDPSFHK